MSIHITLVAYALDIWPVVRALDGYDTLFHIFTHSQNHDVLNTCRGLAQVPAIRLYDYGFNRGLARSWNEGLINSYRTGADVVVIANDDIRATRADLLSITKAADSRRDCGVIEGMGFDEQMQRRQSMAFALCAINPIALETIGYFDENLFPIYYEDCDWSRRASLAGVKFYTVEDTDIVHTGSATVKSVTALRPQQSVTMQANSTYYQRKWGGIPGEEKFIVPFNDPAFNLKITADMRHEPYPGYNRTDQDIVKV